YYKVLLENNQVRVLEYRLKAGEKDQCIRIRRAWYMCSAARNLSLVIQAAERKRELLLPGRDDLARSDDTRGGEYRRYRSPCHRCRSQTFWTAQSTDYMTTDRKLPTSGPLTSDFCPPAFAQGYGLAG